MRIIIVRHGEPDYANDSLTEKGKKEAELLSNRLVNENIKAIYCSPMGRARLTAQPTADKLGMEVQICDWLREFEYAKIRVPYLDREKIPWDLLPEFVSTKENIYSPTLWREVDFIAESQLPAYYDDVVSCFDSFLSSHGYERDGYNYRAIRPNHDTIVLFCHFGLQSILLSHLMNTSPYTFWQNSVVAPTAITIIHTEQRRENIASMRVFTIGDTAHLYVAEEKPSFMARFCECFTDDTRHD